MSRNLAVLEKSTGAILQGERSDPLPSRPVAHRGEYTELIARLFSGRSVVALLGTGFDDVAGISDDLARDLAASGRRVGVVPVGRLMQLHPQAIPSDTVLERGTVRNVWYWPAPPGQQIEFFKSRDPERWLDSLRARFDSVLLCCPPLDAAPGAVRFAAMADSAVLIAEAESTLKQEVRRDHDTLRSGGVNLAGCILVRSPRCHSGLDAVGTLNDISAGSSHAA